MKLRRVLFVSQKQAEAMRPPKTSSLISITDPSRNPATFHSGWVGLLRVSFDDVDAVTFPGQDKHLKEISAEQVFAIADFVAREAKRSSRIVVHCRHGVSRSAAVAKAIADATNIHFPNDYNKYNKFVYLSLKKAVSYAVRDA